MPKSKEKDLTVFLDRHIPRDNLLYQNSNAFIPPSPQGLTQKLQILELIGEDSKTDLLRKPDFQRATAAWTPKECVDLLESVLTERVVPSLIMWRSPDKQWYVLDGSHRISVVLAWLKDDWGDKLSPEDYMDEELEERYKKAAKEVRKELADRGIKKFEEYRNAYNKYIRNNADNGDFFFGVDPETAKIIEVYRGIKGSTGFSLQWVDGDYAKAEESFLNINKSGRKLTDWEKRLVENRNSSLARTVMSVSNVTNASYCWPKRNGLSVPASQKQIASILEKTVKLHSLLFEPSYDPKYKRLQQPILVESRTEPDTKPAYLAEFITVIRGYQGSDSQTENLLKLDRSATEMELLTNGSKLLQDCIDVCTHLIGPSSQPQSLSLVPALYFYSDTGKHIRSLLYGFVYWLFYGDDEQKILQRKLLFSVHREAFERILLDKKKSIVSLYSRNIGSGSEVTRQMAKYYQKLLELLIKHKDETTSEGFSKEYEASFQKKDETSRTTSGRSRSFTSGQKSTINLRTLIEHLPRCGICGGLLDLASGTQYDHTQEYHKKGATVVDNGRPTHPFCNNNRSTIEQIKSGKKLVEIPSFIDAGLAEKKIVQLSFLTDLDYDDYDSPVSGMLE